MKHLTKGILTAAILISPAAIIHGHHISANSRTIYYSNSNQKSISDLDVSNGWTNIQYNSDIQPDVDKVFLQNQEIVGNQKGVLVQAGNLGDSSFKAQKVIPMKKGFKYDLDLIYAQYYNQQGQGYIDFNGDKITSNDDHTDHHYKKTIIPEKDMNYIITVSFTTVYPGNAYFKIAYDKSTGGISNTPVTFEAPIVNPAPEAGSTTVSGTAYKGNTVVVSDDKGDIGTAKVTDDGKFNIKTNRALKYKEILKVVQKNDKETSPAATVDVVDTKAPDAPILNKITDEDKEISGTAEPYSTVDVTFITDSPIHPEYSGTVNSDGKFTIPLEQTYLGKTVVMAKAVDEAGHESSNSKNEVLFSKSLEINLSHRISSDDTLIVGKTSRPKCELTVHFGSRIYSGSSDEKGNFSIPIDKHKPSTKYSVIAVDPRDPEDPASTSDKILPSIPNMNSAKSGMKVLNGVSDPGAEISLTLVRGQNKFDFKVTSDDDGVFSIPLKDKDGKDLALMIGDKLNYSAKLLVNGETLTSEEGSTAIYTF